MWPIHISDSRDRDAVPVKAIARLRALQQGQYPAATIDRSGHVLEHTNQLGPASANES
jgi:hypothetical protein